MSAHNHTPRALALALLASALTLLPALTGGAQAIPVKQIVAAHFGAKVNASTGADVCTVESGNTCQAGEESAAPGGFASPGGVAVGPHEEDVYVADANNHRVQKLSPSGRFLLMIGGDVNKTTGGDVCTAAEEEGGDTCGAGVEGSGAGEFAVPESVAVDQSNGDLFAADVNDSRVDEFTEAGKFVMMFGREVNKRTHGTICTAAEAGDCGAGARGEEKGALKIADAGGAIAVGGPESLVYVADEKSVQEFYAATGEWKAEIPLTFLSASGQASIKALAVDEAGNVYLAYGEGGGGLIANKVYKFAPSGAIVGEIPLRTTSKENAIITASAIAVESSESIAVVEIEETPAGIGAVSGSIYDSATGHFRTSFSLPDISSGIGYSPKGALYATIPNSSGVAGLIADEVVAYKPVPIAELTTQAPIPCVPGAEVETSATFDCTLKGQVNPEGVSGTTAWFQWGRTNALGLETAREAFGEGTAPVAAAATLDGLRPNETYYYGLAGVDANVFAPELLRSEAASFQTPAVAPRIEGAPVALLAGAYSAVLFGELDPQHARTEYWFEYGSDAALAQCPGGVRSEACPGVAASAALESAVYGRIGATIEVGGLQPGTLYDYRLTAEGAGGRATPVQGTPFTTATVAVPQASTGAVLAGSVTSTGAVVSGTVDPEGQPVVYQFELGVDEGAQTQYDVVSSGALPASGAAFEESLQLRGLQPGTPYSYRIRVVSAGRGESVGAAQGFTTAGLPEALGAPSALAQLPVPAIAFPAASARPKGAATNGKKANGKRRKVKRPSAKSRRGAKHKRGARKRRARGAGRHGRGKGAHGGG